MDRACNVRCSTDAPRSSLRPQRARATSSRALGAKSSTGASPSCTQQSTSHKNRQGAYILCLTHSAVVVVWRMESIRWSPDKWRLDRLEELLQQLAEYGGKYKGPEYCEAMRDALMHIRIVRSLKLEDLP